MTKPLPKFLLLPALLMASAFAAAAPDLSKKSDTAPLYAENHSHRFETLDFTSADGKRRYRVYVGIPKTAAPPQGFAALYALDGNALTEMLGSARIPETARQAVLVLIGYDTDLRFDTASRAFDYTPPDEKGQPFADTLDPSRTAGGAAPFLKLVQTQIRPAVEARVKLNPQAQTLWGHSYGGLFVLYTLLNAPSAFNRYIAADPALWHQNGRLYHQYQQIFRRPDVFAGRTLLVEQSGSRADRKNSPQPQHAAKLEARRQAYNSLPPDSSRLLVEAMRGRRDIRAHYRAYPELNHGTLLPASFANALENTAAPTE